MIAQEIATPPIDITTIESRWGDEDRLGHINNVVYFRYFEETRVRLFEQLFGDNYRQTASSPVLVHSAASYLKPLHYPSSAIIKSWLHQSGNTSLTLYHQLFDSQSSALCTVAEVKLVWINLNSGQSSPLPPAIKAWAEQQTRVDIPR
ncbi:acyl-CoA thioester hydrolase [Sinobacterium caligoides]|uniref:Acyl-CoA thioester hydrolase n=1 Tax=Sinobacterium caligoides TaxID=933926 RepID=A0A3N2E1Z0_9GAMM|nr:thioesterase family protein [Sinobacterium caligoides]ROS06138.1 acyl-CoA thioester hydrolase [Sinobacterium caligoides]